MCEIYLEVAGKASCLQREKIKSKSCWDVGKMHISFEATPLFFLKQKNWIALCEAYQEVDVEASCLDVCTKPRKHCFDIILEFSEAMQSKQTPCLGKNVYRIIFMKLRCLG